MLLKAPLFAWKTKQAHQAIERVRRRRLLLQQQQQRKQLVGGGEVSVAANNSNEKDTPTGGASSPAASPTSSAAGASSYAVDVDDDEDEDYGERCAQPHLLLWPEGQFTLNARLSRWVSRNSCRAPFVPSSQRTGEGKALGLGFCAESSRARARRFKPNCSRRC